MAGASQIGRDCPRRSEFGDPSGFLKSSTAAMPLKYSTRTRTPTRLSINSVLGLSKVHRTLPFDLGPLTTPSNPSFRTAPCHPPTDSLVIKLAYLTLRDQVQKQMRAVQGGSRQLAPGEQGVWSLCTKRKLEQSDGEARGGRRQCKG